jgi:hypothetical protein
MVSLRLAVNIVSFLLKFMHMACLVFVPLWPDDAVSSEIAGRL